MIEGRGGSITYFTCVITNTTLICKSDKMLFATPSISLQIILFFRGILFDPQRTNLMSRSLIFLIKMIVISMRGFSFCRNIF
jgi:hypothetical protein